MKRLYALVCTILMGCACSSRYGQWTLPSPADQRAEGEVRLEWTRMPDPVLPRGSAGRYDRVDALNPSVLWHGQEYRNLYSGFDGRTWHTLLARSSDGMRWHSVQPVLTPEPGTWEGSYIAANGAALQFQGRWMYWYQAGAPVPSIGLATSEDGVRWTRHNDGPVLRPGPRGSWDERGVGDPYAVVAENQVYMFHLVQDRASRQRLSVARSSDGIHWQKLLTGPVLELGEPGAFDDVGLGEPAVWTQHGWWWMLYTARDRKEFRRLGLARSRDGVEWQRVSTRPVLEGREAWESAVVCDPSVLQAGDGSLHVWYGGGNRPEPAENLNGQIGYARLRIYIEKKP